MNKPQRNQAIECCRLVAAIGVVFAHVQLPGQLFWVVNCFFRFAVPFFFAVSGYFSFGISEKTLGKRTKAILKLNILATAMYLVWRTYVSCAFLGMELLPWFSDRLSLKNLIRWLVLSVNPFAGHLWYLNAVPVCYLILYVYNRWGKGNYRPLYLFGSVMLAVHIVIESFGGAVGIYSDPYLSCNALLMGVPFFAMGIFIREHQNRLWEVFNLTNRKLVLLLFLGLALTLLQGMGTGIGSMPVGIIPEVFALMLLVVNAQPFVPEDSLPGRMIALFGGVSTFIYITHMIWADGYNQPFIHFITQWLGKGDAYIRPFLAAASSLAAGIVWELARQTVRKKKRKSAAASDGSSHSNIQT